MLSHIKSICFLSLVLLSTSLNAIESTIQHKVFSSTGLDYNLGAFTVGYSCSFHLDSIDRYLTFNTDVTQPLVPYDIDEYRLRVGVEIDTLQSQNWKIPLRMSLVARNMANNLVSIFGMGTELNVSPGYYSRLWAVAIDICWDSQLASNINHSDLYKNYIYNDVQDGWYAVTGNTIRIGLRSFYIIRENLELSIQGGYELHGHLMLDYIPPFYAIFSVAYMF
ncbi:MAG: hypothetical protein JXL85_00455 [Bacilli bacterium]|nr:hypothetical protein [Bacilli bacterium]